MDGRAAVADHRRMTPDTAGPRGARDTRRPARRRSAVLGLIGVLALAAVLYGVAILVAPTQHADGACTGIGFGCTPSPRDTLVLLGVIAALPTFLGALVLGGAGTAGLLRWTRLPGAVAGIIGGLASGAVCGIVVLVVLMLM